MREKIARAICMTTCPDCRQVADCEGWKVDEPAAHAVLQAMSEPTPEMVEAMTRDMADSFDFDWENRGDIAKSAFRAAIRAAQQKGA